MNKKVLFYCLELPMQALAGVSCALSPEILYFSTQRKMELWQKRNEEKAKSCRFSIGEISIQCAKDLVRESRRKKRVRCYECGK